MKFAFLALVLAFVAQTFRDGLRDLSQQRFTLSLPHLGAACVVYVLAQAAMGTFWRRVLLAIGHPTPAAVAYPTFFISQLGKYVPGKASVVLIRAVRLHAAAKRRLGASNYKSVLVLAGAASFYETLCYMAAGSLIAAGLIPFVHGAATVRWLGPVALGLAAVCLAPALPPIFHRLLARFTSRSGRAELRERLRQSFGYDLAVYGVFYATVAWALMSVSLWLVAESIGMATGHGIADLPLWALATTLPSVAGFVSLLPAGIGVREAVTLALLAPVLGDGGAVAITAASRLVGVATEVLVCVSLLVGETLRKRRHSDTNRKAS